MWAEEGQGGGRWVDGQPNCWELSEALMLLSTRLRSARQAAHCTAARSTWPCTRHRTVYLFAWTLCSGQGSRCPSRLHTILGQSHLGHAVCNPSSVPRHALPRCYAKLSKLSPLQPCSTLFDDPVRRPCQCSSVPRPCCLCGFSLLLFESPVPDCSLPPQAESDRQVKRRLSRTYGGRQKGPPVH